jgi:hypothetical protein
MYKLGSSQGGDTTAAGEGLDQEEVSSTVGRFDQTMQGMDCDVCRMGKGDGRWRRPWILEGEARDCQGEQTCSAVESLLWRHWQLHGATVEHNGCACIAR